MGLTGGLGLGLGSGYRVQGSDLGVRVGCAGAIGDAVHLCYGTDAAALARRSRVWTRTDEDTTVKGGAGA